MEEKLTFTGLDYIDMTLMHFPIGQTAGKPSYDYVAVSKHLILLQVRPLTKTPIRLGKKWRNTPAKEN